MAKLNIRKVGDEVLGKVCRPVEEITPRTLTLLDDMIETMRATSLSEEGFCPCVVLQRFVGLKSTESCGNPVPLC